MRSILSVFPVPEVHFRCFFETGTLKFFFFYVLIFSMRVADLLISRIFVILNM